MKATSVYVVKSRNRVKKVPLNLRSSKYQIIEKVIFHLLFKEELQIA